MPICLYALPCSNSVSEVLSLYLQQYAWEECVYLFIFFTNTFSNAFHSTYTQNIFSEDQVFCSFRHCIVQYGNVW